MDTRVYESGLEDVLVRKGRTTTKPPSGKRGSSASERRIVVHVPAVLWERDGDTGRFTYVSREAARLLGFPVDQWTERPDFWHTRVHPEDREEAARSFRKDVLTGSGYSIEYRMLASDGRVVWVRDVMSVVLAHGRPPRTYGVLLDITMRKLAEDSLGLLEERLRRQNSALLDIATQDTLHGGDLPAALGVITEAAATALDVDRVSVWTYESGEMQCIDLYERASKRHSGGAVLTIASYPAYFAALEAGRAIAANSAREDPRTSEHVEYLASHGIAAMLDAPVRLGGRVVGVLCLEHVGGQREWAADEEQFAGSLADLVALAMEANERRKAELALRASKAQTRAVVQASRDAIFVTNAAGEVVEFNRAAEAMFGVRRADILGTRVSATLVPVRLQEAFDDTLCRWRMGRESASEQHVDLVGRHANGTEFPMEITAVHVPEPGGALTIAFVRDPSKPRPFDRALRDEHDHLEALVEARTQDVRAALVEMESFTYTVSHDLRAPIRAIEAFSDLLREECGDQLGDRGERYLDRIQAAARRLSMLVRDFLLLGRVASADLIRAPIDLTALARTVFEELRQSDPRRNVTFIVPEGLEATGDPGLVQILLENLLGNAWKFTARHARAVIEVGVEHPEGETVFFVRDDGAGFDPAYVSQLFRPFTRLHAASEFEGTGIGLAIARRIVERHEGRIWAEASVERGATFRFTLGAPSATGQGPA